MFYVCPVSGDTRSEPIQKIEEKRCQAVKRSKIVAQLQSELVAAGNAAADRASDGQYTEGETPEFFDGYWAGRILGLNWAIRLLLEGDD